ncbi:pilus assembly protein MshD [Betaproteobacteria bacterium SCN2]|jgi:MSHA pilin protein MshD|nr:pilus assembly protein MshD [Betaproteobacteria bacterium SCN2]
MSIRRQAGISLVELILFIVIVSIGLAGILSVMNLTTRHSADPMVRKQALAAAESLMEEIALKNFSDPDGSEAGETRPSFDDIDDYHGYSSNGIRDINETPIGALADYQVSVAVTAAALGGIAAGEALRITVTVSGPGGESITLDGYRTNYAP